MSPPPNLGNFYSSTSIRDVSAPAVFHDLGHFYSSTSIRDVSAPELRQLLFFDLYLRCLRPRGIPCSSYLGHFYSSTSIRDVSAPAHVRLHAQQLDGVRPPKVQGAAPRVCHLAHHRLRDRSIDGHTAPPGCLLDCAAAAAHQRQEAPEGHLGRRPRRRKGS